MHTLHSHLAHSFPHSLSQHTRPSSTTTSQHSLGTLQLRRGCSHLPHPVHAVAAAVPPNDARDSTQWWLGVCGGGWALA